MIKNCIQTNNLISSKNTILIFNILRNLGLTPTLKGTKLLNKAIQIVINSNNEFIVIEDVYNQIALNCVGFNSAQIRNAIKYAIDNAKEGDIILILGKGHETYQEKNGERTHFDDREEVLKLFK